ncbi:biogenesis of lysosome-related organelles complex 1 subunit 1-like [Acanthaster planci]|uniref:Biogenesis of lysosome-related organelles complex 1 subunit 1 n=1 Tax=Acanthaster planci TaxID=133434 RepID=A0A8B7YEA1_ACAPL|nr:biogenesis of lysosome-related organelles complex 1 subunit 1-like [Acanthaster planci]
MLASMLKEHQAKQATRKDQQEKRRKEATVAALNVTKALVGNVNNRVSLAYTNEKRLDAEARQLQANAAQFAKQSMQWLSLLQVFSMFQQELGDVENWAKSIEVDMLTISSALEYALKDT